MSNQIGNPNLGGSQHGRRNKCAGTEDYELLAIRMLLSGLYLLLKSLCLVVKLSMSLGFIIYLGLLSCLFGFFIIHTLIYINKFIGKSMLAKAITSFMKVIADQYC